MQTVERQGYFSRIGSSIKGVLLGLLLFFGSFVLLYINEGLQKDANVIEDATKISAETLQELDGVVAVTGTVTTTDPITTDGEVIDLGETPAIFLKRDARTYAWVEEQETREEEQLGGSVTRTTTYNYTKKWVNTIPDTATFKEQSEERVNKAGLFSTKTLSSKDTILGVYSFSEPEFASLQDVQLREENILKGTQTDKPNAVFISRDGQSTYALPAVGDSLLTYSHFPTDKTVTLVGRVSAGTIVRYNTDDENIYKLYLGDFESAVATAKEQDKLRIWMLRLLGFAMMFIGLTMVLNPLSVFFKLVPMVGSAVGFLTGVVAFVASLILTIITIVVSIVAHNPYILAVVVAVSLVAIFWYYSRKRKKHDEKSGASATDETR